MDKLPIIGVLIISLIIISGCGNTRYVCNDGSIVDSSEKCSTNFQEPFFQEPSNEEEIRIITKTVKECKLNTVECDNRLIRFQNVYYDYGWGAKYYWMIDEQGFTLYIDTESCFFEHQVLDQSRKYTFIGTYRSEGGGSDEKDPILVCSEPPIYEN